MSEETQWFVMQGEEQLGPYTGTQLVEFATNGNIIRESLVWAEGMENWLPAGQIEGIFPPMAAVPVSQPAVQASVPGYPGMAAATDPSAPYPGPPVGNSSFGLWLGLLLGGFALSMVGWLLIYLLSRDAPEGPDAQISDSMAIGVVVAIGLVFLGAAIAVLSVIPFYITLYRAWKCLQPGGLARCSPGQAVGFMFIPFFNYYWIFQAIKGLATDWNRTVDTFADLKAAPRLSEGVFLTFCIGCFLPPLGPIMMFPLMSQMCKAVNYFAFRPQPGQGVFGAAGGGGFQVGGFTQH